MKQKKTAIEQFISKMKMNKASISDNEILINLISKNLENINLKTRIYNAKDFTMLNVIAKICEILKLVNSAETLTLFNELYKEFMISENGQGRKEIIEVLSSRQKENDDNLTLAKKLTTNLTKNES